MYAHHRFTHDCHHFRAYLETKTLSMAILEKLGDLGGSRGPQTSFTSKMALPVIVPRSACVVCSDLAHCPLPSYCANCDGFTPGSVP